MQKVLQFISNLKKNNNREWFQANKEHYQESLAEFEDFIFHLITKIEKFDPAITDLRAKDCIFRIYNDIRFARNKPPYKENFGAWIVPGGKKSTNVKSGYYLHIEPGASFVGGGMYRPAAPDLMKLRRHIEKNSREFRSILNNAGFKKYYPGLWEDDKLSRPPAGFNRKSSEIEMLKYKSYVVMHSLPDELVGSDHLLPHLVKACKLQYPFNCFLNLAFD